MGRPLTQAEFYSLNEAIQAWAAESGYPVTDETLDEATWAAVAKLVSGD